MNSRVLWDVVKSLVPPAALIVAVLGSIFAGITTPTEASGSGALGAILLAAYNRKLSVKVFKEVLLATYKTTGYVFAIFITSAAAEKILNLMMRSPCIEQTPDPRTEDGLYHRFRPRKP